MAAVPSPIFSVAPMMERTDRHFRALARVISRRALLYTEMVTAQAVVHGDRERLLGFDAAEHPLAVQLGGDDPELLARAAAIARAMGYDEINLNVGCPSPRVQSGSFGACLMRRPEHVARLVRAMRDAVDVEVTVKHRIGVDELDRYEDMARFVDVVAEAGCRRFIVHARKAWLQGLSPAENRTVPPLRHAEVARLKREHPHLCVETNGGIADLAQARGLLGSVDAVMVGRAFYDHPMRFAALDQELFGEPRPVVDVWHVVEEMARYMDRWVARGGQARHVARHLLGLFAGERGARAYRRELGRLAWQEGATGDALRLAVERAFVADRAG